MNFFKSGRGRVLMFVVAAVVIGGVAVVGAISLKADQDAAIAKYGAEVMNLCKTVSKVDSSELPSSAKVAVVNASLSTIYDPYQKAFAAANQAAGRDDITHVVCMNSTKSTYDTDTYGGKFKCTRYRQNFDVYIVDVKTGKTISYQEVQGTTPPECPGKTDKDLTRYGDYPLPADIVTSIGLG